MAKSFTSLMLAGFMATTMSSVTGAEEPSRNMTLYKSPQCGCCESYADYMRSNGYTVEVSPTHDLSAMSRDAGISDDFQGCHLGFVDGYVVSGHVPVNVVERLLTERPDFDGVTLPGMPLGSPGMGGDKAEPFTIYEVGSGQSEIYTVE